jgi:D-arabinose 1-dehydrogenase-like Zn-dependent alcohol dehydrogenase
MGQDTVCCAEDPFKDELLFTPSAAGKLYPEATQAEGDFSAVSWTSEKTLERKYFKLPVLAQDEARVRVTYCSLTYQDLALARGEEFRVTYPVVPGCEGCGVVIEKGAQVTSLQVGDRVGIGYFRNFCGLCEFCQAGQEQFCRDVSRSDFLTFYPKFGALASVVQIKARALVLLSQSHHPLFFLPFLSSGLSIFSLLKEEFGTKEEPREVRAAVVGLGGLGQIAMQLARAMNITAMGFTKSAKKKAAARSMGLMVGEKISEHS